MQFATLKVIGPSIIGTVGSYHRHMDNPEEYAAVFAAVPDMLAALKAALPHVERLASFNPTTVENTMRVRQARKDRDTIVAAIAKAEGRS